jgi:CheY-like chemotaxis protein
MRTLMIIDDDPDDIQIFCEAIHEIDEKARCLTACSAQEGLRCLKNSMIKPDYIFLDINMPRMNGKQCLEQIKSDPFLAAIPVIIYTTSKIKKDVDETMLSGASYFLTKPSKFEELVNVVKAVLQNKFTQNKFSNHLGDHEQF